MEGNTGFALSHWSYMLLGSHTVWLQMPMAIIDISHHSNLEFPIRRLYRLVLICCLIDNLLLASPVHGLEALRQNRVRVVEA
jgi:hypothetical protein